jgi:hypothetical protein
LASERAIAALGILTGGNGQRLLQEMPQSEEEEGTGEETEP